VGTVEEVEEDGERQLLFRDPKTSVLNYSEGRNKKQRRSSGEGRLRDSEYDAS
jgi:hypothetical protein